MSRTLYWIAQASWMVFMTLYLIHKDRPESIPVCLACMIVVSVIGDIANNAFINWLNRQ